MNLLKLVQQCSMLIAERYKCITNQRQNKINNTTIKILKLYTYIYKRSVLRRQSRDTSRNIKWSVYCQYG